MSDDTHQKTPSNEIIQNRTNIQTLFLNEYDYANANAPVNALLDQKASVIIFTRYRSGSSFVGELLNQHPDIFYVFEPLKLLPHDGEWLQFVREKGPNYLEDVLQCKFNRLIKDSIQMTPTDTGRVKAWKYRSLCAKNYTTECKHMQIKRLEKKCEQYTHVAAKIIRIYHISVLVPLIETGKKIIYLIRDPRGAISSRIKVMQIKNNLSNIEYLREKVSTIKADAAEYCRDLRENLSYVKMMVLISEQFHENYVLARYEDFASTPHQQAKKMYNFLGIDFHQDVKRWISQSTSLENDESSWNLKYAYKTKRNSKRVAFSWKDDLPYEAISIIQNECAKEMKMLGYLLVNSPEDLKTQTEFVANSNLVNI